MELGGFREVLGATSSSMEERVRSEGTGAPVTCTHWRGRSTPPLASSVTPGLCDLFMFEPGSFSTGSFPV